MRFIEGVGLKKGYWSKYDMIHWSFKHLEVIIYIPNTSFTHNIDYCSQNQPRRDMQDLAKCITFLFSSHLNANEAIFNYWCKLIFKVLTISFSIKKKILKFIFTHFVLIGWNSVPSPSLSNTKIQFLCKFLMFSNFGCL